MEVNGKVLSVLPAETGVSGGGKNWQKITFVLETEEQYPKKVALVVMSEKLIPVVKTLTVGQKVTAHINIESREYQGKWFSNITAWRIDKAGITPQNEVATPVIQEKVTDIDLPF